MGQNPVGIEKMKPTKYKPKLYQAAALLEILPEGIGAQGLFTLSISWSIKSLKANEEPVTNIDAAKGKNNKSNLGKDFKAITWPIKTATAIKKDL